MSKKGLLTQDAFTYSSRQGVLRILTPCKKAFKSKQELDMWLVQLLSSSKTIGTDIT
jgi:hypothetical protein